MTRAGTDIYQRFQPGVVFASMKAAGEYGTIVKMSNSTGPADYSPSAYVSGAHAAGLRVGGYHYAMGSDPVANANAFADALQANPLAIDWAPALDYEDATLPTSAAGRRNWAISFFTRLKQRLPQLNQVMFYASGSVLAAMGASLLAHAVPGLTVLIWDAEYGSNNGVQHVRTYWTGATAVHQYTSNGRVAGISQVVDRDAVYVDISAVISGGTQPEDNVTDLDTTLQFSNPGHTRGQVVTGPTNGADVLARNDNWQRQQLDRMDDLADQLSGLLAAVDAHGQANAAAEMAQLNGLTGFENDVRGAFSALQAAVATAQSTGGASADAIGAALAPLLVPAVTAGLSPEVIGQAVASAVHGLTFHGELNDDTPPASS